MYVADISVLVTGDRGPCSKYDITIPEGHFKGELEFTWSGDPLKVHRHLCIYICTNIIVLRRFIAKIHTQTAWIFHSLHAYMCRYPKDNQMYIE